jgi:hypothetical protein
VAPALRRAPTRPGQPERQSHDDVRLGTTDLFAALDVWAGTVIGETHRRHRSVEFRAFVDTIDANTPPEPDLHLILGNAATHKTALIQAWLVKRARVHLPAASASEARGQTGRGPGAIRGTATRDPPIRHSPEGAREMRPRRD